MEKERKGASEIGEKRVKGKRRTSNEKKKWDS